MRMSSVVSLSHVNTWTPVDVTIWRAIRGVVLLKEVCH